MRSAALLILLSLLSLLGGCAGEPGSGAPVAGGDAATPRPTPTGPIQPPPAPDDPELAAVRRAHTQNPADPAAAGRLAVALFERGRTEDAVVLFEQIARDLPTVGGYLNLARAYTRLSRFPEAEETYRKVLSARPNQPVALHSLGNIAMRRGETAAAIDYYTRAVAAKPDYILARFHLGDALKEAERYAEAYETYGQVLQYDPATPADAEAFDDALYKMAQLDIVMGRQERGAQMLAELLRTNPGHRSAHYAYGQVLMQLGREAEAEKAFARHLEIMAAQQPTSGMATGQ